MPVLTKSVWPESVFLLNPINLTTALRENIVRDLGRKGPTSPPVLFMSFSLCLGV